MKKILLILTILLAGLTANATDYYIATTGNDVTGDGSIGNPWASLYKATSTVAAGAHTIHVAAGTYIEPNQSVLAEGVSIVGAGVTSVITTAAAHDPILRLTSASEGTNGNQSISYLKFDGDLVANTGIRIYARSNVIIHDCTFIDMIEGAIRYSGRVMGTDVIEPTIYATGNKIYNNIITNCSYSWLSGTYYVASGAIGIGGQKDMEVYNNTINSATREGYGIKYFFDGYLKGLKIYNNTITVAPKTHSNQYSFAIELWWTTGGIEIYDNVCHGSIDMVNMVADVANGYAFAAKIHDNEITFDALPTYGQSAILIEKAVSGGTYIYNNYTKNHNVGVALTTNNSVTHILEDVSIYYNVFYDMTLTSGINTGAGVSWTGSDSLDVFNRIKVFNNVFYNATLKGHSGIRCESYDIILNDIEIKNNIFINFTTAIKFENNTVTGIDIFNNCINLCTNNYDFTPTDGVTDDVYADNLLATDPLFIAAGSNFRLQEGSSAINAGTNVSLTSDYDGNPIIGIPDIGAFEYQTLPVATTGLGWEDVLSKRNFKDDVNLIKSRWMVDAVPITATAPEINNIVGVTSGIQGQLDAKAALAAPVFTGSITITAGDTTVTAAVGKIVYKTSDNHLYVCKQLTAKKWYQLDN